ncbi:MAG: binary toxin-like calcium binding domain-containing protein [Promethearchaeota archaeon]
MKLLYLLFIVSSILLVAGYMVQPLNQSQDSYNPNENLQGKRGEQALNSWPETIYFRSYFPGEIPWSQTFGTYGYEEGYSIWHDGNYLYTCGITTVYGAGLFDLLLIKWDLNVNLVWNRTWCGPNDDLGSSITSNGTYLYTCGYTQSYGVGSSDLLLVKWDLDGNQIWNRTWGGSDPDSGSSIWCDGFYIYTCGYTQSYGAGSSDLLLVKWDADGNQIWNRTWGGSDPDSGSSIWCDGFYIYTSGYTSSYGAGSEDLLLVKWDADGNQIWNRAWGGSSSDIGYSIWINGTSIYTCGHTLSYGAGNADLLLVKWDSDGNQQWNRTLGGSDHEVGFSIWCNGAYLYVCGYTKSYGAGAEDLLLAKLDMNGSLAWNRTWGASSDEIGYSIRGDANYLYTCGSTWSFGAGNNDLLLIKWDTSTIDLMVSDVDNDGLSYYDEVYVYNTNATNSDTDSDGLSDGDEVLTYLTNATNNDTDSDGLSDGDEVLTYLTNATNNDTDADGIPDGWEIAGSLNPLINDGDGDLDLDGLSNLAEYLNGTDVTLNDTDGDGLSDGSEVLTYGTSATNNDTDGDGLSDGSEVLTYGTSATNNDTDGDGLSDGSEVLTYGTSATNNDTDGDGLSDGEEIQTYSTNATNTDTDGDGYSDFEEVEAGTDPINENDYPREQTTTQQSISLSTTTFIAVLLITISLLSLVIYKDKRKVILK